MNWSLILKYVAVLPVILGALEMMFAEISAGQSAESPPLSAFIAGKHGNLIVTWTPLK